MRHKATTFLRVVLSIILVVGMVLSANVRMAAHDLTESSQIVAQHHADVEEHGHAHDDIADLFHAYHGHAHDAADHDHNIAFLQPRTPSGILLPTRNTWALANNAMLDRRDFGLDRPPRV